MNKTAIAILMASTFSLAVNTVDRPNPPEGGFGRPSGLGVAAITLDYKETNSPIPTAINEANSFINAIHDNASNDNLKIALYGKMMYNQSATVQNFNKFLQNSQYNIIFFNGKGVSSYSKTGSTYNYTRHGGLSLYNNNVIYAENIEFPSSAYYFIVNASNFLSFYVYNKNSKNNKISGGLATNNSLMKNYANMFKNGLHAILGFNSVSYNFKVTAADDKNCIWNRFAKNWISYRYSTWISYIEAVEHYYLANGVSGEPAMIYQNGMAKNNNGETIPYIPYNEYYHNMYRGPIKPLYSKTSELYKALSKDQYRIGTPNY